MKLRNKNTGKIDEGHIFFTAEGKVEVSYMADSNINGHCVLNISYDSIAELSENFEIIRKTEPLIKDEKIRKAVRAWAEANNYSLVKVGYDMASEPNNGYVQIHFEGSDIVDEDKYGVHTIAELCGEEEE